MQGRAGGPPYTPVFLSTVAILPCQFAPCHNWHPENLPLPHHSKYASSQELWRACQDFHDSSSKLLGILGWCWLVFLLLGRSVRSLSHVMVLCVSQRLFNSSVPRGGSMLSFAWHLNVLCKQPFPLALRAILGSESKMEEMPLCYSCCLEWLWRWGWGPTYMPC